jgi:hypothetical protein
MFDVDIYRSGRCKISTTGKYSLTKLVHYHILRPSVCFSCCLLFLVCFCVEGCEPDPRSSYIRSEQRLT